MLDEKKNKNKRVAAMKNVVPKTKEKPDADYAVAVAALVRGTESNAGPKARRVNTHT